jgi:hypothetical protein
MNPSSAMSDETIFDTARSCLELFRNYLSENRPSSVRIETEQQRFWAWSNTLKVFAKPHICLDAQLHADKYAQIRRMVLLLLGVLRKNLSLGMRLPGNGFEIVSIFKNQESRAHVISYSIRIGSHSKG